MPTFQSNTLLEALTCDHPSQVVTCHESLLLSSSKVAGHVSDPSDKPTKRGGGLRR